MSPLSDVALFFTHGSFCFRWCDCTSCRSPGDRVTKWSRSCVPQSKSRADSRWPDDGQRGDYSP